MSEPKTAAEERIEEKARLIKSVQNNGDKWYALAASSALEFARDSDDPVKRDDARRHVAICDAMCDFSREVVELIHEHWPTE